MNLYNVIHKQTNKYTPYYILPEPTISHAYCSKPIVKSIQLEKCLYQNYLNNLSTDDIHDINTNNNNYDICEAVYIRVRRTDTNSGSEWKQFIQKS
uniref:Uncharacterized protein n=1 Tax=viral metagenome TaxID=1070528 RepID=A0A6C0IU42_9ZZZZ